MSEIKAIETVYNGYKFRSRLEARWAVFFDAAGIKYEYEPQGFELSDGTKYLPDFYLPEMHQFFECKGVMTDKDEHKIEQFIADSNKPVVIGYDGLTFVACNDWWDDIKELDNGCGSILARCTKCNKLYFLGLGGSYTCTCCGHYDGDHFDVVLRDVHRGFEFGKDELESAREKAKQARFEFGECG